MQSFSVSFQEKSNKNQLNKIAILVRWNKKRNLSLLMLTSMWWISNEWSLHGTFPWHTMQIPSVDMFLYCVFS